MSDNEKTPELVPQSSPLIKRLKGGMGMAVALAAMLSAGIVIGRCGQRSSSEVGTAQGHEHEHEEGGTWTCAMHPQVRSDGPGACPICGMDLIVVEGASDGRRVSLSNRAALLSRIETEKVRVVEGSSEQKRLLGRVDYDETRMRLVTAWIPGRVDRLHVAATGQRVRLGQKVATLYSPEVYAAHSDLLQAGKQRARHGDSDTLGRTAQAALQAARKRLQLLGISDKELGRMEAASEAWRQIPIRANVAGTVIERLIDQGAYVQAGTGIYRVADLSRVWVQLDAYESDLPKLRVGQVVKLTVEALPSKEFDGKVAFIDPVVDSRTRTTRVRVIVDNKDHLLRPGMFAEARVEATGSGDSMLSIRDTAPLFTGRRSVVFVEVPGASEPTYELQEVTLGAKVGNRYPVLSGLERGQRVVTRGAFVLDADLQLRGGYSMMAHPDDSEESMAAPLTDVSSEARKALAPVVEAYLLVGEALAADNLTFAKEEAAKLAPAAANASASMKSQHLAIYKAIAAGLQSHSKQVIDAPDLDAARLGFESLTSELIILLRRFGNPLAEPVHLASCPMAMTGAGALWVQRGDTIQNSYEGQDMLTCGSFEAAVEPGQFLPQAKEEAPTSTPASAHDHGGM